MTELQVNALRGKRKVRRHVFIDGEWAGTTNDKIEASVCAQKMTVGKNHTRRLKLAEDKLNVVNVNLSNKYGPQQHSEKRPVSPGLWAKVTGQSNTSSHANSITDVSWCDVIYYANQASYKEGLRAAYNLPKGFGYDMSKLKCARFKRYEI